MGYRRHTIKRARDKLGIHFTDELRTEIIQQIRKNKHVRHIKLTTSRSLHEIRCIDKYYYPIYSKTTKEVVTLLDKEHAERLFAENNTTPGPEGGRPRG